MFLVVKSLGSLFLCDSSFFSLGAMFQISFQIIIQNCRLLRLMQGIASWISLISSFILGYVASTEHTWGFPFILSANWFWKRDCSILFKRVSWAGDWKKGRHFFVDCDRTWYELSTEQRVVFSSRAISLTATMTRESGIILGQLYFVLGISGPWTTKEFVD